jgi:hypothetical protein
MRRNGPRVRYRRDRVFRIHPENSVIGLIVDTLTLCAFVPEDSHRKISSVKFSVSPLLPNFPSQGQFYNVSAPRSLAIVVRSDLACLILRHADAGCRYGQWPWFSAPDFGSPEHTSEDAFFSNHQ